MKLRNLRKTGGKPVKVIKTQKNFEREQGITGVWNNG